MGETGRSGLALLLDGFATAPNVILGSVLALTMLAGIAARIIADRRSGGHWSRARFLDHLLEKIQRWFVVFLSTMADIVVAVVAEPTPLAPLAGLTIATKSALLWFQRKETKEALGYLRQEVPPGVIWVLEHAARIDEERWQAVHPETDRALRPKRWKDDPERAARMIIEHANKSTEELPPEFWP
jgi:hypothetical protein